MPVVFENGGAGWRPSMSPRRKLRPGSATSTSRGTTPCAASIILAPSTCTCTVGRRRDPRKVVRSARIGGLAQRPHGLTRAVGVARAEAGLDRLLRLLPEGNGRLQLGAPV